MIQSLLSMDWGEKYSGIVNMDEIQPVNDSQPEDLFETTLSWDYVEKEKQKSTRKAKQLDRLQKELKPLNNEFNEIPLSKSRNSSFQKNNQFTVVSAEFLNLSTKKELNQLFDDGYTKDEIENMLENKYQEKKHFFTDLNVKHHKFKRKNFEAWRTMSNSHSVSTSTFASEEELISQISKSERLKLKRINNKPLKKFKTVLHTPKDQQNKVENYNSSDSNNNKNTNTNNNNNNDNDNDNDKIYNNRLMRSTNEHIVPKENGLLGLSKNVDQNDDQNSSLIIMNEVNKADDKCFASNKLISPLDKMFLNTSNEIENSTFPNNPSLVSTYDYNYGSDHSEDDNNTSSNGNEYSSSDISDNINDSQSIHPGSAFDLDENGIHENSNNMESLQILNTQSELVHIFSDKKGTTGATSDQIHVNENENENEDIGENNYDSKNLAVQLSSSPNKVRQPSGPLVTNSAEYTTFGRRLRHRNIVNRNPYLVDRAEYLGLSTKYELINLAEDGKTDDEILNFLDDKYQKRREERKSKEVGYGPFSKKSFYEIMDGQHNDSVNSKHSLNPINDSYAVIVNEDLSEEEFELSFDGDYGLDIVDENIFEVDDGAQNSDDSFMSLLLERNNENVTPALNTKVSNLKYNQDELAVEDNNSKIAHMVQKKRKSSKLKSMSTQISKKRKVNDEVVNNMDAAIRHNAKRLGQSISNIDINSYNPYSMDLLTLSDDESISINKKHVYSKVSVSKIADTSTTRKESSSSNRPYQSRLKISEKLHILASPKRNTIRVLDNSDTLDNKQLNSLKKNKPNTPKDIVAASYAPRSDNNFVFNRNPNMGTYQEEGVAPNIIKDRTVEIISDFNPEFARNTEIDILKNEPVSISKEEEEVLPENATKLQVLWDRYKDSKDINLRKYKFILNLRPSDYKTLTVSQKFLSSSLLSSALDENGKFYRKKDIKLEFLSTSLVFETPLNPLSTLSKLQAFYDILLGAFRQNILNTKSMKQLRKSLIYIIMIISNISNDCPDILPKVGLEMNSFLNRYKKITVADEMIFCVIGPYFLIYMEMFQKLLPSSSEYLSSFNNTSSWLCKKIVLSICQIPFEKIFINVKTIVIESLFIFLRCKSNPWSHVCAALFSKNIDILNVVNFLYFCNSYQSVEMDWEYYISILNKFGESNDSKSETLLLIKSVFASILKINRELSWNLEDQILIKMFRLLAEYKFDNIGSSVAPRATIYASIPATDSLTEDDGCLNIYFKVLNIYTKQYLSENTRLLVERLIPIRSTLGYSPVQFHNRAQILLMMVYMFDQDLMVSLESILNDMIRNGSVYSVKSALALIRTIIRQTSRKPYSLVRKYLPLLIRNINKAILDKEVMSIFKDLVTSINELLNGHDISHLKRMLDFFSIILKMKHIDNEFGFDLLLNQSFAIISQQFDFLNGIEISEKEDSKLKKYLSEIADTSKKRILDKNSMNIELKKNCFNYWLFSSFKREQSAIQLLYTEWNYFGDAQVRDKYEVVFYTKLVQLFDISGIQEDILNVFFKNLPMLHIDLSVILQNISKYKLLPQLDIYKTLSSHTFQMSRISLSIKCLSSLLKISDEQLVFNVLKHFIKTLKSQLINHEAKKYIREVGVYLFTVANDKFEIPEWDYLVDKLKLETVMGSLSKKLQFVETVNDAIIILEKTYINAFAGNTYDEFLKQFKEFTELNICNDKIIISLSTIISCHTKIILKNDYAHWVHLKNWLSILKPFLVDQTKKIDLIPILQMLCDLTNLNKIYASNYDYRFYYYNIMKIMYSILEWLIYMFHGFSDEFVFLDNFWVFARMDPVVDNVDLHNKFSALLNLDMEQKVANLFQSSSSLLENKIKFNNIEKDIYILEMDVKKHRESITEKWSIRNANSD